MATTADFKNGLCLEFKNDIYTIVEFQHVKPGKGGAFVRTKLKSLTNGKVVENTFTAGEKVETARVEKRPFIFSYKEEGAFVFMHKETFDEVRISEDMIPFADLMKDGQEVDIYYHAESEKALSADLPPFVELLITYSEPGVKGNTATNATKKATLETGAVINVPMFIEQDELIKVDTRDYSYVERVKK